jgi:transposase
MRGWDDRSGALFSYLDIEVRVPKSHPLRVIRDLANEALAALAGEFSVLYASTGRPSIPPEKLLRAMLLQAFYSIRSERLLMERLIFDLLFRWLVGLGTDDCVWDHLDLLEEPRSVARWRRRSEIPCRRAGPAAREAASGQ